MHKDKIKCASTINAWAHDYRLKEPIMQILYGAKQWSSRVRL